MGEGDRWDHKPRCEAIVLKVRELRTADYSASQK